MKIVLDVRKSVQENAAAYYEEAKKLREKAAGAGKAAKDMEKRIAGLDKEIEKEKKEAESRLKVREKREKDWFERFRWFRTSAGKLCIAGRDAKQNEVLVSKHLEKGDLFFHAEIHGAPATILKQGQEASDDERLEAAQFAGSYSSAWKEGLATVDVYAVPPEQVSKHAESGESVGKGGFIIRGEREWFRNCETGLLIGVGAKGIEAAPSRRGKGEMKAAVEIRVGNSEKGDAAKLVLRRLGEAASLDEILQALPSGKIAVK
jgi:predicted ribosome quality control (RQC) complex YloA/Tae2 family protein